MRKLTVAFPPRPISSTIGMNNIKLAVVGCIAILTASPAAAQGGGDFGLTLPQNGGPRYLGDEERGKRRRRLWGVDGSLTKEAAPDLLLERAVGRLLRRIGARVHLCRGRSGLLSSMLLWLRCRPTLRAQSVPVANTRSLCDSRGPIRLRNRRLVRNAARFWFFRAGRSGRQLIVGSRWRVLLQRRLSLQQRVELLLDLLLVEQLLVCRAVELCAEVSDTFLIAGLHFSHRLGVVFAQRKISGRGNRPHSRDDEHGPDNGPAPAGPLR